MGTAADKGRLLEERITEYFGSAGYTVKSNQVMEGRSGGRHEIDVLAERSDALLSVRVAVECKAWEHPVEKDVVSKLHYLLADLGLNKGVIVSLQGWRQGAKIAAEELGIDLWGPDELRLRLGASVLSEMNIGVRTAQTALGVQFAVPAEPLKRKMRSMGKGVLGLRTVEELTWFGPVWLPAYLLTLNVARLTQQAWRRQSVTNTRFVNCYEAVDGSLIHPDSLGEPVEIDLSTGFIKPLLKEAKLGGDLRGAVDRWISVSQPAARQRHAAKLTGMGIPLPCQSVVVEKTDLMYLPIYLGLLRSQGRQRFVAFSGRSGSPLNAVGTVLTSNEPHVRESLGAWATMEPG